MSGVRVTILGLILSIAACGGKAKGPEDAVLALFEALRAGDGAGAVTLLSSGAVLEVESRLAVLREDPEAAAAQLALLGIPIDPVELADMTAVRFAEILFSSRPVSAIMTAGTLSIGSVEIDGDSAEVRVTSTFLGETGTRTLTAVLEDGAWKLATL